MTSEAAGSAAGVAGDWPRKVDVCVQPTPASVPHRRRDANLRASVMVDSFRSVSAAGGRPRAVSSPGLPGRVVVVIGATTGTT
ncbi:MAG: hypothetical protein AAF532_11445 [Planctomycetota bacterium]